MDIKDAVRNNFQGNLRLIERTSPYLEYKGFRIVQDAEELNGKILAANIGTNACDFTFYPIERLVPTDHGYKVIQPEGNAVVVFADLSHDSLEYLVREGPELFIPKYLIDLSAIWVGDNSPSGHRMSEAKLEWRNPAKIYVPEEQIAEYEPELYEAIIRRIDRASVDSRVLKALVERIADSGDVRIVDIETRTKTPSSLFGWLHRGKGYRTLENAWDINGIRVVCEDVADCYAMLHAFHNAYDTKLVRDWISIPKMNLFQSLVVHPNGIYNESDPASLEFQILTRQMRERGDNGLASDYRLAMSYPDFMDYIRERSGEKMLINSHQA